MADAPAPRGDGEQSEQRYQRVQLAPEQRRLVRFILTLVAVAVGFSIIAILVATH